MFTHTCSHVVFLFGLLPQLLSGGTADHLISLFTLLDYPRVICDDPVQPQFSPQTIHQKATSTRKLLVLIANPEDWWSDIRVGDNNNDASPFTEAEEQLEDLATLYSYNNNQQN